MSVEKLVEHFSALEDPRCAGKGGTTHETTKVLSRKILMLVTGLLPAKPSPG